MRYMGLERAADMLHPVTAVKFSLEMSCPGHTALRRRRARPVPEGSTLRGVRVAGSGTPLGSRVNYFGLKGTTGPSMPSSSKCSKLELFALHSQKLSFLHGRFPDRC